jgi:asparagine synthase (glutamine-hydrolysing)
MGFGVPLASWFRGPLKEQVRTALLGETMVDCGLFDQQYLTKVVDQHQSGLRDYSTTIWSLLMFNSFLENSH